MISLNENEKIVMVVHRHWFILFGRTIGLVFLLTVPFIAIAFINGRSLPVGLEELTLSFSSSLGVAIISVWFLIVWLIFFAEWTDHYLDGLVITNERIIDIEQRGFFSRQVSTFNIDRIQDVTIDIHGIIATLLDFGDVHVQTAGESQVFLLKGAPDPEKVRETIQDTQQTARQSMG